MDLESLMQSLSLHTSDDHAIKNFNIFAVQISENHTDIVFGEFTNKCMLIATQYGNVGSLLRVDKLSSSEEIEPVYSISIVFGCDKEDQQAAARFIAESLNICKPLLLFLCLKDYQIETVKSLVEALLTIPNIKH